MALLLRLAFLESEGRMNWFPHVGLRRVHIIAERLPMMHRHGWEGPKLDKAGLCFAWFVFERGHKPLRTVPLRWVSWKAASRVYPSTEADITAGGKASQRGLFERCMTSRMTAFTDPVSRAQRHRRESSRASAQLGSSLQARSTR